MSTAPPRRPRYFRRRRHQPSRPGIPGEPWRPPAGAAPALQRAAPAAARLRRVHHGRRKNGGAASVLSGRPRLDAGELRLLHRRLHGQRRHHLAGRRRDHARSPSLRGFMQPYAIVEEGPRGGLKKTSVVDDLDDASAAAHRSTRCKPAPTGRGRPSRKTA